MVSAEVSPMKGALAGDHLVENRAETEDVGARIGGLPRTCSGDM